MNDADNADIVKRIVGTWPMSPKGFLWTDVLREFEYGPALAAFTQLRNSVEESRISIARFIVTYRAVANVGNTRRGETGEVCDICAGTGMHSALQRIGTDMAHVVVACTCPAGRQGGTTVARVDSLNAASAGPERRTDIRPVIVGGQESLL